MIANFTPHLRKIPTWLILAALTLLTFGLFVPRLGFYWDDWPIMFFLHNKDYAGLLTYYSFDRPFAAYYAISASSLAGVSTFAWQIFLLALRASSAIVVWKTLRLLWPSQKFLCTAAALLFAVYPGYDTQPMVSTYVHWATYLLFLFSLMSTGNALRNPQKRFLWTSLSLFTQALNIFTLEFFVILELTRPLYIAMILADRDKIRGTDLLKKTLAQWAPYLALLVLWALWRFFILTLPQDPHPLQLLIDLRTAPFQSIFHYGQIAVLDVLYLCATVWWQTASWVINASGYLLQSTTWIIALLAGMLAGIYLRTVDVMSRAKFPALLGMSFGVVLVFAGLAPVWVIGDAANTGGYGSHYLLGGLFGACVFCISALSLLPSKRLQAAAVVVLVVFAVGRQTMISNEFSQVWETQRDFYWQLHWRAPAIKPNTALVFFYPISDYMHQSSTSMAVNTLYPQSQGPGRIDYWTYDVRVSKTLEAIEEGEPLETEYRRLIFRADDAASLLFLYKLQDSCVWILSSKDVLNDYIPSENRSVLVHAGDARILPSGGSYPDVSTFGSEPSRTWCYYFEKADLAAQLREWQMALDLLQEAELLNLRSDYAVEYFPLIEAHAQLGMWDQALQASLKTQQVRNESPEMVCALWDEMVAQTAPSFERDEAVLAFQSAFACR